MEARGIPSALRAAPALILWAALALVISALPTTVRAAGVVGNGSAASCSEAALRAAVAADGTVSFNCGADPVTIVLAAPLALERRTLEIDGGGKVTLSGGGKVRVITASQSKLTLRGLTIRDGRAAAGGGVRASYYSELTVISCRFINNDGTPGGDEEGGGGLTVKTSTLVVRDSFFEGNRGINGGGLHSLLSGLLVERSVFVNNDTTAGGPLGNGFGAGAGIYTDGASYPTGNATGGQVIIRDSYFRDNRAMAQGGGVMTYIYPPGDSVLIEGSVFEGNEVLASPGGAAAGGGLRHGNGPIVLRNSLFVNNTAGKSGGGFWSGRDFPGRIENVTFVNNRAQGASGTGGGLFIDAGDFTIVNSTIADNYATSFAGGIMAVSDRVTLLNTIMAGNWAEDGTRIDNQCSRAIAGGANNLQSPSRATRDGGDYPCASGIRFADPQLGPLADNGGPFATLPLLAGSPAIDAGSGCPAVDARHAPRVGACDIGAFEFGGTPGTAPPIAAPTRPPAAPTLKSLDADGPILRATWLGVSGASHYQLEVRSAAGERLVTTAASRDAQGMPLGRGAYQLRVRACNQAGCSAYSAALTATVTSDPLRAFLPLSAR